jgi:hypothetical protein
VTRKENPVEHGGRYVRPFGFSLLSPHGRGERERERERESCWRLAFWMKKMSKRWAEQRGGGR